MLKLLLDEHISPGVAIGLRRRVRAVTVHTMQDWDGGNFLGHDDAACLQAAAIQKLTMVTYDRRTIPPLLKTWAEHGRIHGGVIFVDEKTSSPADIGGLVRTLADLIREAKNWDWMDRICFLTR